MSRSQRRGSAARVMAQGVVAVGLILLPMTGNRLFAEVPNWLDAENGGPSPAWISAGAVSLDEEMYPESLPKSIRSRIAMKLTSIREYRKRTGDQGVLTVLGNRCVIWSVVSGIKTSLQGQSVRTLFENSHRVYVGTLTDYRQGFVGGYPGSLLEVEVEDELKEPTARTRSRILVHFEHAEVPVDGETLCSKSIRYPDLPTVGKRIMVFQYKAEDGSFLDARNTELIYEGVNETISLPPGLLFEKGARPSRRFDQLKSALKDFKR